MGFSLKKLFSKKEKEEMLVALDIGTEYVKAVLFSVDRLEHKIIIHGYGKCRQQANAMQGAMIINIKNVINACDLAIGSALSHADRILAARKDSKEMKTLIPKKAVIGIAGELVRGITIIADYDREDQNSKIAQRELDEVISQIKGQAFSGAVADIAEEIGLDPATLVEINSKISSTDIDGLHVDDPIGFTGKNISYHVYSTFAPLIHINSIKEIANSLGLDILSIEVEPYAVARAIKDSRNDNFNSIVIDIGGGTTDIAVIDKGAIVGTKMFAFGGRVFTKRIAKDLSLELNAAENVKIDYSNGHVDKVQKSKIHKALLSDVKIWCEAVEIALSEVEDVEKYPGLIYLCGGASLLPDIEAGLLEYPWLTSLPFNGFPKVKFLFPNQLIDIIDDTRSIKDPSDIAPLALARMALELNT